MASYTVLGPGVLTLGSTPEAFEGEVVGGNISHDYDEADSRTMLNGDIRAGDATRSDGLSVSIENDLTATGIYKYLFDNDGQQVPFVWTPNSADGASWSGTVTCRLPATVGADEFGSPIVSDLTLPGVGAFTFTPAT